MSVCIWLIAETMECRHIIARYHNIFGREGTWTEGREKAPAAICRKIAMARYREDIEVWGDGEQTRSFLYIDQCVGGHGAAASLKFCRPGQYRVTGDGDHQTNSSTSWRTSLASRSARSTFAGPLSVRGLDSDNRLIKEKLRWEPSRPLRAGLEPIYRWIRTQGHEERNLNLSSRRGHKKWTPKIGPRAKVKSAPGSQEEQTDEQEDKAAA